MSNQAGARQDAEKKRREYLARKAELQMGAVVGLIIAIVLGFATFGVPMLWWNLNMCDGPCQNHSALDFSIILLSLMFFGGGALIGSWLFRATVMASDSLPYVPPVKEQLAALANLPAEEILLRHSNQPSAVPEELLRAADQALETVPNELLRPMETA